MKAERWQRVNDLFQSATERAPGERAAFLDEACHGDQSLSREVESLLTAYERAENFIELPAFEVAPELLTNERAGALLGQTIGHYQIESLIGVGGMGEVYLARDERLGRKVALKLLPERLTADETQLSRFKTEARTASALNHPNILTVYEIGAEGNRQFIATEFIEGVTLRASLAGERINLRDALEVGVQVASALTAAHETGIVHRDIKPENIMLRPDGYVKVLDFGIAKLTEQKPVSDNRDVGTTTVLQTQPGLVLGTARYMSPEQTRGQSADARTDIWSLGVVLYEMVGGISPFQGDTPSDCIASILKTEPPPLSGVLPGVPLELQSIVQKALCKNRDERYRTIKEMLVDLRDLKAQVEAQGSSRQTESITDRIKRHKRAALIALAGVILAAAALAYFSSRSTPALSPPEKSIAVLPFADLSQARDQEYFCDGIQEEILNRLSQIADLKVISRTSTQRYKSAPANLLEIARQLGVAHVVEGSVQKSDDQIRVSVRLINPRNNAHLWTDNYQRKLTDIFAVESEIATKIASALQARLTGGEQRAIASRPTRSSEAHQAYLKGLYHWNKFLAPDFEKSRDYFQQAIELDPSYAVAHAGLAGYYARAAANGAMPPNDGWPKCEAAVNKAFEFDETVAETYNPRAALQLYYQRDWLAAEGDFRRGIELNPNWAEIRVHYALALAFFGRNQDALAEIQRAVELEPFSMRSNMTRARILLATGQENAALAQFRNTIELDANYPRPHEWLGNLYEKKKMHREAIVEWAKALVLSGEAEEAAILEHTYGASGFESAVRALAQKQLAQLKDKTARGQYIPAAEYVLAYARAGDKEQAFTWLAKAVEERNWFAYELQLDPRFESLRSDARFEQLLSKVIRRPSPEINSLAVLPFENATHNTDTEYLSDGISEALINSLTELQQLKVIARSTAFRYKGKEIDPQGVGRELNVGTVLMGVVRQVDDRLNVQVDLVDATTGAQLWGQEYERKLADVLAVKQALVREVTEKLRLKLTGEQRQRLTQRDTTNPEAYQFYLRGRYYWNKRTAENLHKAMEQFQQAADKDPNYALAYAGLSDSYVLLELYAGTPANETLPKAKSFAERALQLDSSLAEVHTSLGYVYNTLWQWNEAEDEFKRAIKLNPNYPTAHHWYGMYLLDVGRMDEAKAEIKRAHELDPLSLIIGNALASVYLVEGDASFSIAQNKKVVDLDPNFPPGHENIGLALLKDRRYAEAIAELEKAVELSGRARWPLRELGYGYAISGKRAEAQTVIKELVGKYEKGQAIGQDLAAVYAGLGDKDQAFAWLEKDFQTRSGLLAWTRWTPVFASLHTDPRFHDLLRRMGFQR